MVLAKEISKEMNGFYRSPEEIKKFLNRLMLTEVLLAYDFQVNKKITEKDTQWEKVVRTLKGLTLTSIDNIYVGSPSCDYFFEYKPIGILYRIKMDRYFEGLKDNGSCDITRLLKNPNLIETTNNGFNRLEIPEQIITGRLNYSWRDSNYGKIEINGDLDEFFERFNNFLTQKTLKF